MNARIESRSLESRVAELIWFHSIDLGNGLVTPGSKTRSNLLDEAKLIFDRIDLDGLSVLDIGAWNGFFSFEAKRRGAARVLATDSYTWAHPYFRGRESFELARSTLGAEVESRLIDAGELSPDNVGVFDAVLYLGVFYHRYDTIETLAKLAPLAKRLLVLETHLDVRDVKVPAMAFYPGMELADDPTNWWGPNELLVKELLLGHGFTEIEMTAHPIGDNRAIFHAWRSTESRIRPLEDELRLKPAAESRQLDRERRNVLWKLARLLPAPFQRMFSL